MRQWKRPEAGSLDVERREEHIKRGSLPSTEAAAGVKRGSGNAPPEPHQNQKPCLAASTIKISIDRVRERTGLPGMHKRAIQAQSHGLDAKLDN